MKQVHEFKRIIPYQTSIKNLRLLCNQVIIQIDPRENERTTSGIYAPASIYDVDQVADFVVRHGVVAKLPSRLYFNPKDHVSSMRWNTDIELQVGDEIWMNHATVNDPEYRDGNKFYKSVKYEDLVVAKRGKKVIPLNGYVLLDPFYVTVRFVEYAKKIINYNFGTIAYMGNMNKQYATPEYVSFGETVYRTDPEGFEVGDRVLFHKKAVRLLRLLEFSPFAKFANKPYLVAQRHMFAAVVEKEN